LRVGETAIDEKNGEVRRVTSVELLDAAIWREIGSDGPQSPMAFLQALSCLLGRWLLIRSGAPAMDVVTVMCQTRAYVVRLENVEVNGIEDAPQHE
jgi:adenylate cyclase